MNPCAPIPIRTAAGLVLALLLLAPASARAQVSVVSETDSLRFTLTVDRLVLGLSDTLHASYVIENLTDRHVELHLCCCGVEFFALRDSSCVFDDLGQDPECQIAGCDACNICFPLKVCQEDPCETLPFAPFGSRRVTWDWDREVCDGDTGADLELGNVGTFRVVAGYDRCDEPTLGQPLSIPIEVLRTVPVVPTTWGRIKARHPAGAGDVRPEEER